MSQTVYMNVILEAARRRGERQANYQQVEHERRVALREAAEEADKQTRQRIDWREWVDYLQTNADTHSLDELAGEISQLVGFDVGSCQVQNAMRTHKITKRRVHATGPRGAAAIPLPKLITAAADPGQWRMVNA